MKSSLADQAAEFARAAHDGQQRETDGAPYFEHLAEVADLVGRSGRGEAAVAAAFLHDILERTDVAAGEIADRFGPEVAELVETMTEDPTIERYEERKASHRDLVAGLGEDAVAIYVADKLSNALDLARALEADGPGVARRVGTPVPLKLAHYERTLALFRGEEPAPPLIGELEQALERLRAAQAAPRA